jgi:catechol 2,3-dioxygenase-like lactoylglutathione lyase family enzyme
MFWRTRPGEGCQELTAPGLIEEACSWVKPDFWISQGEPGQAFHIAFAADERATVDAFHEAAMAAGGRDNGGPGLRPEYHRNYYGAFVFDPDGNNIEAVCHGPQQEA